MSDLTRKVLSRLLPPRSSVPMAPGNHQTNFQGNQRTSKDYSNLPWKPFFDKTEIIKCNGKLFNVYTRGVKGTLIVLLHGGGFSGLSWALLVEALSRVLECTFAAIDLRGHGTTSTNDDYALSIENLTRDVCDVIEALNSGREKIVIVGHSMGGAVAVCTALQSCLQNIAGLVVIDVVEGSAMESLNVMRNVLQNRPPSFKSLEKANEWCVRSGYIRNLKSARISMIGQLTKCSELRYSSTPNQEKTTPSSSNATISEEPSTAFREEPSTAISEQPYIRSEETFEVDDSCSDVTKTVTNNAACDDNTIYKWRIDLLKTEQYWKGWFEGLSRKFLSVPCPKLLLLAGVDRLDRELTVGQMQGKFQMQVLPKSGHAIHEDAPEQVCDVIVRFLTRHKLVKEVAVG